MEFEVRSNREVCGTLFSRNRADWYDHQPNGTHNPDKCPTQRRNIGPPVLDLPHGEEDPGAEVGLSANLLPISIHLQVPDRLAAQEQILLNL